MEEETAGQADGASTLQDQPQTIDVDTGTILTRIDSWVDGIVRALPNIGVGLLVVLIAIGAGIAIGRMLRRNAEKRGRPDLGAMLGALVKWVIILAGALLAATIVMPALSPGDLVAGLGVGSVAIGFAFKDILQNWLAGLLILFRQPFELGDQIEVNGYEGTVEHIQTRSTMIKTYDGQRVLIPNADVYTNAVLVKTAYELRRSRYDIGIGYSDDLAEATDVILKAVTSVDGVASDPAAEVLPWDLAASWVTLRARWWTKSARADVVKTHAGVIKAVKEALDEAGIDMPYETYIQLFHDQTEEADGDRSKQREGWPGPDGGTTPRWKAESEAASS